MHLIKKIKSGIKNHSTLFAWSVVVVVLLVPQTAFAIEIIDWNNLFLDIANSVLAGVSYIVHLSGLILDTTVREMVLEMGENVDRIDGIKNSWTVLRDFGNIIFIFVLLYAAIRIILNLGNFNAKKAIANLVIVALLVNFSFFFTRVVIDGSNILALQFYNSVELVDEEQTDNVTISEVIMSATKLPSVYDPEKLEVTTGDNKAEMDKMKLAIITLAASVFLLVTTFVFLAAAALLLVRFGMLILLMILSPVAFVLWVLPNTKKYAKQWWGELVNQSFFAPIMFALIYVVARIVNSDGFQQVMIPQNDSCGASLGCTLASPGGNVEVLLNFGLVIMLMLATIVVAKQMGNAASSKAIQLTGGAYAGAGAFAARQTAGRAAKRYRDSDFAKKFAQKDPTGVGRSALRRADSVSKNSMDIRDTSAVSGKYAGDNTKRRGGFVGGKERKEERYEREKELIQEETREEKDRMQNAQRKIETKQRLNDFQSSEEREQIMNEREQLQGRLENIEGMRKAATLQMENLQQELEDIEKGISDLSEEEAEARKQRIQSEIDSVQQRIQTHQEDRQEIEEELEQNRQQELASLRDNLEGTGINIEEGEGYEEVVERIESEYDQAQKTIERVEKDKLQRARNFEDMVESGVIPGYGTESDLDWSGGRWKREWTAGERSSRNEQRSGDDETEKEFKRYKKFMEKQDEFEEFLEESEESSEEE